MKAKPNTQSSGLANNYMQHTSVANIQWLASSSAEKPSIREMSGLKLCDPSLQPKHASLPFVHWNFCPTAVILYNTVFAIYQILLNFKTYRYHYETDELPNPRPTQPKKNQVKKDIWVTFSHSIKFFVGWDWFYIGNRPPGTRNLTQPNSLQTP